MFKNNTDNLDKLHSFEVIYDDRNSEMSKQVTFFLLELAGFVLLNVMDHLSFSGGALGLNWGFRRSFSYGQTVL